MKNVIRHEDGFPIKNCIMKGLNEQQYFIFKWLQGVFTFPLFLLFLHPLCSLLSLLSPSFILYCYFHSKEMLHCHLLFVYKVIFLSPSICICHTGIIKTHGSLTIIKIYLFMCQLPKCEETNAQNT